MRVKNTRTSAPAFYKSFSLIFVALKTFKKQLIKFIFLEVLLELTGWNNLKLKKALKNVHVYQCFKIQAFIFHLTVTTKLFTINVSILVHVKFSWLLKGGLMERMLQKVCAVPNLNLITRVWTLYRMLTSQLYVNDESNNFCTKNTKKVVSN